MVKEALFLFGVTLDPGLAVRVSGRKSLQEGARASAEEKCAADKGSFWKLGGGFCSMEGRDDDVSWEKDLVFEEGLSVHGEGWKVDANEFL